MLRITCFGLCVELMLGIVTGLGKCQEFLFALGVDAISTEDECDPGETEYDESLGSSHL